MTAPGTHPCPATACTLRVAKHKLMCRSHWYMVPQQLRDAVNDAWRFGAGAGSPAHRKAMLAAVEAVNSRLAEGSS